MRGFAVVAVLLSALFVGASNGHADVIAHLPTNDRVIALTFDAREVGHTAVIN